MNKKIKKAKQAAENSSKKASAVSKKLLSPRLSKKSKMPESGADIETEVPRITNDTVDEHRKEVLKGGKRFIYPIISTPRRILGISILVATLAIIGFSSFVALQLYRFNDYSDFSYNVTKVLPLPVARIGGTMVRYEDYLFELRRYVHYFEVQQGDDFTTETGEQTLKEQRARSLEKVIDNAYIKKLARQNDITVSEQEIDAELELLRQQNKLGDGSEAFEDVLLDFWGWSVGDYRTSIRQELLTQKVVQALDTSAHDRAERALARIQAGEDFATLAEELSDDVASASNGGEYGFLLDLEGQNEDPKVLNAVFNTQIGEVSGVVNTGYKLEIVKVLSDEGDGKRRAAHIAFLFGDITPALNDLKDEQPARVYLNTD
ncbi:MAG: peptidylprolyl isomerase [Patescibacteria group bacterium]